MSATPLRVLLAGATGALGKNLANGLLADKYKNAVKLSVLMRSLPADAPEAKKAAHAALKARGVTVVSGDASQGEDALVPLLKDIDVVLSALGGPTFAADQLKLVAAAKKAGVKWFVPSEFGLDVAAVGRGSTAPPFDGKLAVRDAIKAAGLDYTYVLSGAFTEYALSPFFGLDAANKTLTISIHPDARMTTTTLPDIGVLDGRRHRVGTRPQPDPPTGRRHAELLGAQVAAGACHRRSGMEAGGAQQGGAPGQHRGQSRRHWFSRRVVLGSNIGTSWPLEQTYNYVHKLPVTSVEEYVKTTFSAST